MLKLVSFFFILGLVVTIMFFSLIFGLIIGSFKNHIYRRHRGIGKYLKRNKKW